MSSLYIGKGTAVSGKPDQQADIIMPLSCFKSSRKPPTGEHLMETTWGNVFYSQRRQTKVSYQILQWFTLKAIMDDCRDHIDAEVARLQLASQSPKAAADLLSPETDAEFTFLDVIRADIHDQLKNHPWIVNGLARMIRQRWLHLATGAGLFAKGLMIMPDDTLPDGVVCSPDLTQEPVIAFPYPCLSWWDIKILDVRFSHDHTEPGTVWMNTATAASMQRDFDGDYCQFLYCSEYQAMASEVREWHTTRTPPIIPKATKRKASHWNNLPRVAMDSMTCPLGWVTNLITKSNAVGRLDLCSQLAAESQIAVDGLKFDVSNNWRLLRTAQKELPELDWLKEAKSRRTFLHETMSSGSDTIGQLVAYVAPNWTPPQQLARPIEEYAHLMPKPEECQYLGDYAFLAYQNYGKAIAGILAMDDPDEQQREISQLIRTVREWASRLNNPEQVFLHLWQIAHRQRSQDAPPATASICFHAFTERICERLQSPAAAPEVIAIVGLHHNAYNTPNALRRLSGLVDTLTVAETTLKGHVRSIAYLAGKALGIVSSETPTMPGSYPRRLIWNGNASKKSLGTIYASAP